MEINGLTLINTCGACPEQYDVKDVDGNQVGYVRLRWGHLYCECPDYGGETVYEAYVGDGLTGCFENDDQRNFHLNAIADAIHCHLAKSY